MDQHKNEKPVRVGVFSTVQGAECAVRRLLETGFQKDQLSVVCSDKHKKDMFAGTVPTREPAGTRAPQAALVGGATGAAIGGIALAVATVATGGTAFLVAGPLFLAGGGVAGGLVGAMVSRGFERETTNYYDQAVQQGKILVAAEDGAPDHVARLTQAEHIFAECGAEPVALPEG
jgi:outer membrane lipoprotein SlyB